MKVWSDYRLTILQRFGRNLD